MTLELAFSHSAFLSRILASAALILERLKSKCTPRSSGAGTNPSSVGAGSRGALVDAVTVRSIFVGAAPVQAGAAATARDTSTVGRILMFIFCLLGWGVQGTSILPIL